MLRAPVLWQWLSLTNTHIYPTIGSLNCHFAFSAIVSQSLSTAIVRFPKLSVPAQTANDDFVAIATHSLWAGSVNSLKTHFLRERRQGTNAEASGTGTFYYCYMENLIVRCSFIETHWSLKQLYWRRGFCVVRSRTIPFLWFVPCSLGISSVRLS